MIIAIIGTFLAIGIFVFSWQFDDYLIVVAGFVTGVLVQLTFFLLDAIILNKQEEYKK